MSDDASTSLHRLVLGYARAVDRRDYAALVALMAPDATIAVHDDDPAGSEPVRAMRGHDEIATRMRSIERYDRTWHLVGNHLTDVAADGRHATGETYCTAHHFTAGDDGAVRDRVMYIRYQDRFVVVDGEWRFAERRLWVDLEVEELHTPVR